MDTMNDLRTYVMAYWKISQNAKNSPQHYLETIQKTLPMMTGSNLIFVSSDKEFQSFVGQQCKSHNIAIEIWDLDIPELQKFGACKDIVERTVEFGNALGARPQRWFKDKGLAHYWRDFRRSDRDTWQKILTIWHSKCDLLYKAVIENPFRSTEFAWVDSSLSRKNNKRQGWNFHEQAAVPGRILHYKSGMMKDGKRLRISAGFLLGDRDSVGVLAEDFNREFSACLTEIYPTDEEVLLDVILRKKPSLFMAVAGGKGDTQGPGAIANTALIQKVFDVEPQRSLIKVVGPLRSGTDLMKSMLESRFACQVRFNNDWWKHSPPPTQIKEGKPWIPDYPTVVMVRDPIELCVSFHSHWLKTRHRLSVAPEFSVFIRSEFIVHANGVRSGAPRYLYRTPVDYVNHFYYGWITWRVASKKFKFARISDLLADPDKALEEVAAFAGLSALRSIVAVELPSSRLLPSSDRSSDNFGSDAQQKSLQEVSEDDRKYIWDGVSKHINGIF